MAVNQQTLAADFWRLGRGQAPPVARWTSFSKGFANEANVLGLFEAERETVGGVLAMQIALDAVREVGSRDQEGDGVQSMALAKSALAEANKRLYEYRFRLRCREQMQLHGLVMVYSSGRASVIQSAPYNVYLWRDGLIKPISIAEGDMDFELGGGYNPTVDAAGFDVVGGDAVIISLGMSNLGICDHLLRRERAEECGQEQSAELTLCPSRVDDRLLLCRVVPAPSLDFS